MHSCWLPACGSRAPHRPKEREGNWHCGCRIGGQHHRSANVPQNGVHYLSYHCGARSNAPPPSFDLPLDICTKSIVGLGTQRRSTWLEEAYAGAGDRQAPRGGSCHSHGQYGGRSFPLHRRDGPVPANPQPHQAAPFAGIQASGAGDGAAFGYCSESCRSNITSGTNRGDSSRPHSADSYSKLHTISHKLTQLSHV